MFVKNVYKKYVYRMKFDKTMPPWLFEKNRALKKNSQHYLMQLHLQWYRFQCTHFFVGAKVKNEHGHERDIYKWLVNWRHVTYINSILDDSWCGYFFILSM